MAKFIETYKLKHVEECDVLTRQHAYKTSFSHLSTLTNREAPDLTPRMLDWTRIFAYLAGRTRTENDVFRGVLSMFTLDHTPLKVVAWHGISDTPFSVQKTSLSPFGGRGTFSVDEFQNNAPTETCCLQKGKANFLREECTSDRTGSVRYDLSTLCTCSSAGVNNTPERDSLGQGQSKKSSLTPYRGKTPPWPNL